jgi:hypothetical protein
MPNQRTKVIKGAQMIQTDRTDGFNSKHDPLAFLDNQSGHDMR